MNTLSHFHRMPGGRLGPRLAAAVGVVITSLLLGFARQSLAASGTWAATSSGTWSTASNWVGNTVANGSGETATFAGDITSDLTVDIGTANRALGTLVFGDADPSTAASWILSGTNTMTLNNLTNNATITVGNLGTNATATIASRIISSTINAPTIVKDGVGTLVLSHTAATNSMPSKFSIIDGTLQISTAGQLGQPPGSFTADQLTISNGATLKTTSALALDRNRGVTIGTGGGKLNLNGGAMSYLGRFSGAGQTVTTSGNAGLTLTNNTGIPTDVDWDITGVNTRLFFNSTDALGTGNVRVRNLVRLTSTGSATGTVGNAITVDSGGGISARAGAVTFSNVIFPSSGSIVLNRDDQATASLTISSGGTLTGDLAVDTSPSGMNAVADVTLSGAFVGAGGLVKTGTGASGRLILAGANTYTGTTSVQTGSLYVNGDQSAATGPVMVAAGTTLGGSGTIGGAVSLAAAATLQPGWGVGSLTLSSSLSMPAGGRYAWQMLSATGTAGASDAWDLLALNGAVSIDSTSADPFAIDLWTLSGVSPIVSGSAANFDPNTDAAWTIVRASGGITGFSADKFVITTTATNGTGGFANGLAGGTFSIAQSGNDLNLVFTAAGGPPAVITINVASGTQTQTGAGFPVLSGSIPVLKTGNGTLVVDQANTLSGSTTVQEGALQVANLQALQFSRVIPVAGGTMTLAPYQTTVIGGLDPNAGGLVDVGNGLVTVASGLSSTDLVTAIVSGLGDGSWNGTTGITSSVAAADAALGTSRAVGWLDNGDGTLTFAYAAPGDTNLDWTIDLLDIGTYLAAGKYDTGEPSTWAEGDYTYDGLVDITDVALYLGTGLFDVGPYNPPAGTAGGLAAVPEPSTLALMVAPVAWLVGLRVARQRTSRGRVA